MTQKMARSKAVRKNGVASAWVKVWDEPTRVFHWSIVVLMVASWVSADQGYMKVHLGSGMSLLTLLIFRLVWGFIGSTTARFSNFLSSPSQVIGYFKAFLGSDRPRYAGHNPAGGWMVLMLIAVLLAQVVTGLFSNDGVKFHGPLALLVGSDISDALTSIHGWIFIVLLVLVWMHVVAVFFYLLVKDENLIKPMVTGYKHRDHVPAALLLHFANGVVAMILLAIVAGALVALLL